jgi:hypothetical protein
MEMDRRSFLGAAGSSLVVGVARVWSAAAQTPASPVSFPGIANPLEAGVDVIASGYIWTSGRGGIYVFSPKGEHIGFAPIVGRVSNCAFGPGRYLYVTNDTQVVRGRIRADFPGGSPIQY